MKKIVTKNVKRFNEKTLIAAVDIGSITNMGYCRAMGYETKPFEFKNNRKGFEIFCNKVEEFRRTHGLDDVVVGIESTGCYGIPFLNYLKGNNMKMVQVNPMHTKRLKGLSDNSPNKTDKKDPRVIADIIELGNYLTVNIAEGVSAELRNMVHMRERLIVRTNELYNQLHSLEFQIFPEFIQLMNLDTKTAKYILKKMPTPEQIVIYGCSKLERTVKEISKGQIKNEKAALIFEAAKSSVGITEGRESIVCEIKIIISEIEHNENLILQIEQKIIELLEKVPYSCYLLSMKGIGEITVAGLIGEIGNFANFQSQDELLKYAGLNIFEASSGKHKGQRHISKIGRPLIRKLLFFAALNTVRKGGIMHAAYTSHCERGMVKIKALTAIMRKLLCIMLSLVRNQSYYRADFNALKAVA